MGYTSKYKGAEIDALLDKVTQGGTGGGVPIVSSEEELEALNLPIGSEVSVANNSIKRVGFSELYQPTVDDVNASAGTINFDKMAEVKEIEYTPASGTVNTDGIQIVSKSMMYLIMFYDGGDLVKAEHMSNGELFNGNTSEYISQVNQLLLEENFVYAGTMLLGGEITESDFAEFDKRLKVVQKESTCEVLLKEFDTLSPLGKKQEVVVLAGELEKKEDRNNLMARHVDHYDYNIAVTKNQFIVVHSSEGVTKAYISIQTMLVSSKLAKTMLWLENCEGVKIYDFPVHWNADIEWKNGTVGELDNSKSYLLELTTIVSEEKGAIVLGNLTAFNIPS